MSGLNQEGRKANAARPLGEGEDASQGADSRTPEKAKQARDGAAPQDGFMNRKGDPAEGQRR
ncbi:MAG TPA: hypothetical protein VD906_07405 [Caulobacteraceae bacterium]|nr:hypothetical protein [Caulobacteraceae bacterium]